MLKMPDEIRGKPDLMKAYEGALDNFLDHMLAVIAENADVVVDNNPLSCSTTIRIRFQCEPVFSEMWVSNY